MAPRPDSEKAEDQGKKPTKHEESKKKPDDIYVLAARRIARCIDLWCEVDKVISIVQAIEKDEASKAGELDEDDAARRVRDAYLTKITHESRETALETYYKILQIVPCLKDIVEDHSRTAELAKICSKMTAAIKSTRSSDATGLKSSIPRYALPAPHDPTSLNPPIINSNGRAEMGLNHPILARWLCPIELIKQFDQNPEQARKDLATGAMPMCSDDFPALFWSGKLPGDDYDPDNLQYGAFKSYFLVRVARHIFLGPLSALGEERKKSRSCNAILNDITTIEPEHIAYVCVQARFGISSMSQWNEKDGSFDYHEMYNYVIHLLKTTQDTEWRDKLLKWWNVEIFGNENGRTINGTKTAKANGDSAPRLSTMAKFHAQTEARLAQAVPEPVVDPSLLSSSESNGTVSIRPSTGPVASTPASPSYFASSASGLGDATTLLPAGTFLPSSDSSIVQRIQAPVTAPVSTPAKSGTTRLVTLPSGTAITGGDSSLSEDDDTPLTPITNRRRGKQSANARGKRPARADADAGETASGSRAKKPKRSRK